MKERIYMRELIDYQFLQQRILLTYRKWFLIVLLLLPLMLMIVMSLKSKNLTGNLFKGNSHCRARLKQRKLCSLFISIQKLPKTSQASHQTQKILEKLQEYLALMARFWLMKSRLETLLMEIIVRIRELQRYLHLYSKLKTEEITAFWRVQRV